MSLKTVWMLMIMLAVRPSSQPAPATQPAKATSAEEEGPLKWGDNRSGCRVRVASKQMAVRAGEPLDVVLEIQNSGTQEVQIREIWGRPYDSFDLAVRNAAGDKAQFTSYENDVPKDISVSIKILSPSETIRKTVRVNRIVDLSESGDYSIKINYELYIKGESTKIAAPEFRFKITD
jgi:hypothetical protein